MAMVGMDRGIRDIPRCLWGTSCPEDEVSKLFFQINDLPGMRLQYTISNIAEVPKPSLKAPDSRYVIHNGKLYPVRPEVQ